VQSEKLNTEFAEMEVSLLAIEAFHRAVLEGILGKLTEEVLSASQKDLGEAESLNQKGLVLGADFYTAKVNGGSIEGMRNQFGRDFKSSRILLNILMGEDPLKERGLDYDLSPVSVESKGVKQWLETAYLYRKDFEALDAVIRAAESEDFRQRMSFLPKISAFGTVEDNTHSWHGDSGNYLLGVKGEMDLFDGTYGARKDLAALKLKEANEDKNALKDSITRALAEESGRYETIVADLPVAERMLSDARNAMEMTEKLYREGKKSVADLLEIRRVYLEIAARAYETRFYAQTSYSRLLFLSGTLDRPAVERIAMGLKKR
jgi:outer membrane protein TolC